MISLENREVSTVLPRSQAGDLYSPLRLLYTVGIGLGITERLDVDLVGLIDLTLGSVTNENGLSSPLSNTTQRQMSVS